MGLKITQRIERTARGGRHRRSPAAACSVRRERERGGEGGEQEKPITAGSPSGQSERLRRFCCDGRGAMRRRCHLVVRLVARDGGVYPRHRNFGRWRRRWCRCCTRRRRITAAATVNAAAIVVAAVDLAIVDLGGRSGTDRRRGVRRLAGDGRLGRDGDVLPVALQILHELSHASAM